MRNSINMKNSIKFGEFISLLKCFILLGVLVWCYGMLFRLVSEIVPVHISESYDEKIATFESRLETETDEEEIEYLEYRVQEIKMNAHKEKEDGYTAEIAGIMFVPTFVGTLLVILILSRIGEALGELCFNAKTYYMDDGTGTSFRNY